MGLPVTTAATKATAPGAFGAGLGAAGVTGKSAPPAKVIKTRTSPAGAPPAPKPFGGVVIMTPQQMAALSATQAHQDVAASQQPIVNQEAQNRQTTRSDIAALGGLNAAAMGALRGIAPEIQAGYRSAAGDIAALGGGTAQGAGDAASQAIQHSQQLAAAQGQGYVPQADPAAVAQTLRELGSVIPATSLEKQGVAAQQFGAGILGAQASEGRDMAAGRLGQEHTDQLKLTQQLETIAAKYPQLRQQALSTLEQLNAKNAQLGINSAHESAYETHIGNQDTVAGERAGAYATHLGNQDTIASRKAGAYDTHLHNEDVHAHNQDVISKARVKEKAAYDAASIREKYSSLKVQIEKANRAGQLFDKNLSLSLGYAVSKDRQPILTTDGKRIPVKASMFSTAKSTTPKSVQLKAYRSAVSDARTLRGHPQTVPSSVGAQGIYLAAPGAKGAGIFPGDKFGTPATTNDPKKATWSGTMDFSQAQTYLVEHRGLTPKKARQALIAAGWPTPAAAGGGRPTKAFADAVTNGYFGS